MDTLSWSHPLSTKRYCCSRGTYVPHLYPSPGGVFMADWLVQRNWPPCWVSVLTGPEGKQDRCFLVKRGRKGWQFMWYDSVRAAIKKELTFFFDRATFQWLSRVYSQEKATCTLQKLLSVHFYYLINTLTPPLARIIWLQVWQHDTIVFPAETAGTEMEYCLKWPERHCHQVAFISLMQMAHSSKAA